MLGKVCGRLGVHSAEERDRRAGKVQDAKEDEPDEKASDNDKDLTCGDGEDCRMMRGEEGMSRVEREVSRRTKLSGRFDGEKEQRRRTGSSATLTVFAA
jgi:hypothetical protein